MGPMITALAAAAARISANMSAAARAGASTRAAATGGYALEDDGLKNARQITAALQGALGRSASATEKVAVAVRSKPTMTQGMEAKFLSGNWKDPSDDTFKYEKPATAKQPEPKYRGLAGKLSAGDWRSWNDIRETFQYGRPTSPDQPASKGFSAFESGDWKSPEQQARKKYEADHPLRAALDEFVGTARGFFKGNGFGAARGGAAAAGAAEGGGAGAGFLGGAAALAGGPIGIAAAAVGVSLALYKTGKALDDWAHGVMLSQRELGKWSGTIARSNARYDVNQIKLDQAMARSVAASNEVLTQTRIDTANQWAGIDRGWENMKNGAAIAASAGWGAVGFWARGTPIGLGLEWLGKSNEQLNKHLQTPVNQFAAALRNQAAKGAQGNRPPKAP